MGTWSALLCGLPGGEGEEGRWRRGLAATPTVICHPHRHLPPPHPPALEPKAETSVVTFLWGPMDLGEMTPLPWADCGRGPTLSPSEASMARGQSCGGRGEGCPSLSLELPLAPPLSSLCFSPAQMPFNLSALNPILASLFGLAMYSVGLASGVFLGPEAGGTPLAGPLLIHCHLLAALKVRLLFAGGPALGQAASFAPPSVPSKGTS